MSDPLGSFTVDDAWERSATTTVLEPHVRPHPSIEIDGVAYYSAADVARELGVSRQSLWKWRLQGKIPPGHRYRDRQVVFTGSEYQAVREYAHRLQPAAVGPAEPISKPPAGGLVRNGGKGT